jgi:hypothetical protein
MVAPSLAPSAVEQSEQTRPFAVYYKDAPVPTGFRSMRKTGNVYHVPFDEPLRVQTPALKLVTYDQDDGIVTFGASKDFAKFLERIEEFVFAEAVERRKTWFKKDLGEDELRAGFKSFVRDDRTVDVKVDDDCVAFDEQGNQVELVQEDRVRCILELSGVCFGRTEFGCMWTLLQAQKSSSPKCLINPSISADFAANFA